MSSPSLLLAVLLSRLITGATPPPDPRLLAAEIYAVPVNALQVLHQTEAVLDPAGARLYRAKLLDLHSGQHLYLDYDRSGRQIGNADALLAGRRRAKAGKVGAEVRARLQACSPDAPLKLAIWLRAPQPRALAVEPEELVGLTPALVRDLRGDALARMRRLAREARARIRPLLERVGARVTFASELAPMICVEVPARAVRELAASEAIRHIYDGWRRGADELDTQTCAVRVKPAVWDAGYSGAGIVVAHVEDSRADPDNLCIGCYVGAHKPESANVDAHSTACAGMLVSNDPVYRGVAYGACYYSANGGSYEVAAMSGAIDAATLNADLQSHSWGTGTDGLPNIHDRHIDYVVRNARVFADDSAGNSGNRNYLTSPGNGYNMCTVANFDDHNSCGWSDDRLYTTSSGRDPESPNGDREKPEIAAPGSRIISLAMTSDPGCPTAGAGSGTSYSAPVIGGIAALLMEADPRLLVWPEAVKAILLAAGLHNLEGARRLSDLDGAGGVDAVAALRTARFQRWDARLVTAAALDRQVVSLGHAAAGQRLKVAVCWDSTPSGDYLSDPLLADIDLDLLGPDGRVIATSASYDNNYEIVDLDLVASGEYKVRLTYRRWEGDREYVAGAWSLSD